MRWNGILIDGNHLAHRAYHRMPDLGFRGEKGWVETGMLYGFLRSLSSIIKQYPPTTKLGVVFDRGLTRRRLVWPDYKAGRGPRPPEFTAQMIAIQHALIMSRMPMFSIEGLEGDEVISLLVDALCRSGVYQRVTVWSSDRDFHQLLTEGPPVVDQFDPIRKDWITADSVEATYGVPPKQFPVLRAFTGDVSDGIPPIRKGIGLKKAAVWVTERKFPITEWEWVLLRRNLQLIRLPTLNDLDRADIPTTFRERVLNVKDPLAPPTFATVGMRELDVGHQLKIMYRISAGLLQPLITYARTRG